MLFWLSICLLVAGALSQSDLDQEITDRWKAFKSTHVKSYQPGEENDRKLIFKENLLTIMEHNEEAQAGQKSYYLSVNEFTDMTHEEFMRKMTGLMLPRGYLDRHKAMVSFGEPKPKVKLPREFTWRAQNIVTPVKNQMQCGSCWGFAATGALEGQWAKASGNLISLSEQNLVDCSSSFGNQGCNGGWPNSAFDYIINNGGINEEACYPYTAMEDTCNYDETCNTANMTSYTTIPYGREEELSQLLYTKGPLAICIDAGQPDFQSYAGGVYDNQNCRPDGINHAVLVVGYGTEAGKNYWLIKNSWGSSWGENGYIKIAKTGKNLCGVATLASQPII